MLCYISRAGPGRSAAFSFRVFSTRERTHYFFFRTFKHRPPPSLTETGRASKTEKRIPNGKTRTTSNKVRGQSRGRGKVQPERTHTLRCTNLSTYMDPKNLILAYPTLPPPFDNELPMTPPINVHQESRMPPPAQLPSKAMLPLNLLLLRVERRSRRIIHPPPTWQSRSPTKEWEAISVSALPLPPLSRHSQRKCICVVTAALGFFSLHHQLQSSSSTSNEGTKEWTTVKALVKSQEPPPCLSPLCPAPTANIAITSS